MNGGRQETLHFACPAPRKNTIRYAAFLKSYLKEGVLFAALNLTRKLDYQSVIRYHLLPVNHHERHFDVGPDQLFEDVLFRVMGDANRDQVGKFTFC